MGYSPEPEDFMTLIKGILAVAAALGFAFAPVFAAETSRAQALEAAVAEIEAAEQTLRDAEDRRQRAAEPLPGERLRNVDGHSRLTPDYFERQRALAAEVDAARARLDEAYRQRNRLRE
jgi:hypothetical protein